MVGYVGVYRDPEAVHMSVWVAGGFRRSGVAQQLAEDAFTRLPEGLEVEAWVGGQRSFAGRYARRGFDLVRVIEDGGRKV